VLRQAIPCVVMLCAACQVGCGGAIRRDELSRGVESLGSMAAEGQLLAEQAAARRSKTTFTRVHARELGDQAAHEAEKLEDAASAPATASEKAQAVALAQAIGSALSDLQVAPTDRAGARTAARQLTRAASRASRLAGEL
jgi:hypothetical protein